MYKHVAYHLSGDTDGTCSSICINGKGIKPCKVDRRKADNRTEIRYQNMLGIVQ